MSIPRDQSTSLRYEKGRVAIAHHHASSLPITTAVVYGVPKSQAHPQALAETESILEPLTREVVLGRHGPRIIAGDFNHPTHALRDLGIWMEKGWVELQSLALARWGRPIENTCKEASRHDFIWLSPEAAALCRSADYHRIFADHIVLEAVLYVPPTSGFIRTWPRPATVPWEDIDIESWHVSATPLAREDIPEDSSQWFQDFTQCWEQSIAAHSEVQEVSIPGSCTGRASRVAPATRAVASSILKASRPGEVTLKHDLLGREVKRWFQQLRRLQNLRNALRGGKQSEQAQEYRRLLWRSIREAKGFNPNFLDWWPRRAAQLQGSPSSLHGMPDVATAEILFEDFQCNFRRLENWHAQRRADILNAKYAESARTLFTALQPERPAALDTLVVQKSFTVLAINRDTSQIHLEGEPGTQGSSCFRVDGDRIQVVEVDGPVCQVAAADLHLLQEGAEIEQEQFITEPDSVFHEFINLWQPRWNQHSDVGPDHWSRILNFTRFLTPVASFVFPRIHQDQWLQAVRRMKRRAARGPDAYARADLLHMAPCYVAQLLHLLQEIEQGIGVVGPYRCCRGSCAL